MEIAISSSSSSTAAICRAPIQRPYSKSKSPSSQLSFSSAKSSFFNTSILLTTQQKYNSKAICIRRDNNRKALSCTCLFGLGMPELVVIAGVAALLFGPKKLPEVGRSIGKTVKSFQQAAKEFETELKKEPESGAELGAGEATVEVTEKQKADEEVASTKENSNSL